MVYHTCMEYLDLKGLSCPLPVVETKKVVDATGATELRIELDQGAPYENVSRFLESCGYCISTEREGEDWLTLRATRAEDAGPEVGCGRKKVVVLIDGETVGRGDDTLGAVLMKAFLHTLKELSPLPWRLIFINAGVKLTEEGSDYLPVLGELEGLGIEVLCCGTCLDFFKIKERFKAGRVTNMYEILSSLTSATTVLRP
jgi:selenium metabolism protein YedF